MLQHIKKLGERWSGDKASGVSISKSDIFPPPFPSSKEVFERALCCRGGGGGCIWVHMHLVYTPVHCLNYIMFMVLGPSC